MVVCVLVWIYATANVLEIPPPMPIAKWAGKVCVCFVGVCAGVCAGV